jgi:hypothetical protein
MSAFMPAQDFIREEHEGARRGKVLVFLRVLRGEISLAPVFSTHLQAFCA